MVKSITRPVVFAVLVVVVALALMILDFSRTRVRAQDQEVNSEATDDFVRGRVLVKFRSEIMPDQARQIIAALGARDANEIPGIGVHVLDLPYQASEFAFQRAFQSRPEVEFAELDRLLSAQQMEPNDPLYADSLNSWSLRKIKGPEAWAVAVGSSNVTIAILDTGVDGNHEDLVLKIVPGRNIYNNNSDTSDVTGHGTAVAGQATASSNNGLGVASVCWECRIMPVRISDNYGYASYSDIASGLSWAADHGARVANISYNVTGSSTVSSAARYFQNKGGIVAAAAGNQGTPTTTTDDPYIITVGATDQNDLLYSFSNSGKNLDLVAPGMVSTTVRGGSYGVGGGTSAAAPQVAGAAGLVFSLNPSLTAGQVEEILEQSADDLAATGWDSTFGWGRLNLEGAVNMALGSVGSVDSTAPTINITSPGEGNTVSGTVTVTESTSGNVVKVELYIDGAIYASSKSAPFNIKWNTRKAGRGAHSLQSKAYDAAGNVGTSSIVIVYK